MNILDVLREIAYGDQLRMIVVVIAADFVFGVAAALYVKPRMFDLAYVAQLLKDDVGLRLLPWVALVVFAKVMPEHVTLVDVSGVSLDFGNLGDGLFALIVAEQAGSILKSLTELGVPTGPLSKLVGSKAQNIGDVPVRDLGDLPLDAQ